MAELLDVTLRDGGYINNFNFIVDSAKEIVANLYLAGVDWIEIGYRKGPFGGINRHGLTAHSNDTYINFLREQVPDAKLVVMLHPQNTEYQDLVALKSIGISMIRICVREDKLEQSIKMIEEAKKLGLYTSANFVRVTNIPPENLIRYMISAELAGADIIYFADSNGNMVPEQVYNLTKKIKSAVEIKLGFHAHNNLSLGLPNTLAAIDAGAEIVDSSLRGMGRGAGNMATEVYAAFLERMGINSTYDIVRLIHAVEVLERSEVKFKSELLLQELIFGMGNLSGDFFKPIKEASQLHNVSLNLLAYEISKCKDIIPQTDIIQNIAAKLINDHQIQNIHDKAGTNG